MQESHVEAELDERIAIVVDICPQLRFPRLRFRSGLSIDCCCWKSAVPSPCLEMANEPATNALAGVGRSDRDLLDVGIPVHNSCDDIAGDLSAYFCNPDLALLLAAAERAHVGRMFGDFWHTYRAKNLAGLDFELCEQLKIGTTSRTDRKTRH